MDAKNLFGDSCEANNVIENFVNSLMGQDMQHPVYPDIGDNFEDEWENAEALQQYNVLDGVWGNSTVQDYESLWREDQADNLEQAWAEKNTLTDAWVQVRSIKNSAGSILESLSRQSDPKFKNSEFFKFVEKLHLGKAKIENGEVIEEFEDVWSSKITEEPNILSLSSEEKENFEEIWKKFQETDEEKLLQEWGKQWSSPSTAIVNENPYKDLADPYSLGLEKLNENNYHEGIMLLEAELLQRPENSVCWMDLGKVFLDLGLDSKALECFKSGLEQDPYNTDNLLLLATASLNEYDYNSITQYFTKWISNNFEYSDIIIAQTPDLDTLKQVFLSALEINSNDPNLYLALGIINFANRKFNESEYYFNQALELRPNDWDLHNKVGVAALNQGKFELAMECFQKSITIKPGFVKAWINMARVHVMANSDYKKAVECYLSGALIYGSESLFEYIRSAFVMMGREDLIEKLKSRNPIEFADEFEISMPIN